MLTPELESELRTIIRSEVDAVIGQHIRDAFGALVTSGLEPLVEGISELLNQRQRLITMEESLGQLIRGQARVETAIADNVDPDANAPWRASLEDVDLDDADD